jgi:hypothetical protein
MGPDCYLYFCNRSSTTSLRSWTLVGPDWYLLLQQKQHHLPEELDRWDLTATYSCNRSCTTSLRSCIGGT